MNDNNNSSMNGNSSNGGSSNSGSSSSMNNGGGSSMQPHSEQELMNMDKNQLAKMVMDMQKNNGNQQDQ
jgi:hypothetical protein